MLINKPARKAIVGKIELLALRSTPDREILTRYEWHFSSESDDDHEDFFSQLLRLSSNK